MIIDSILGYTEVFVWIGYFIVLLPSLAVGSRRLHDTGRSGWWQLLYLTGIGSLVILYWNIQKGTEETNKFG